MQLDYRQETSTSQGDLVRIRQGIMVNFFGTLISDILLSLVDNDALCLQEGDFEWS